MSKFNELSVKDFQLNPFALKNEWMLITAEKDGKVNTMTASWGGFGVMWNKEVVFVVIRPQRYTKEFVDFNENFSLSFFKKGYKKELNYLGSVSGREEDKISKSGLHVAFDENIPYFEEAESVIFAKKLYAQPTTADSFIAKELIEKWYPNSDHHILYIAEVTKIYKV